MNSFRNRRATSIENDALRVTVLHEGGHIAEILDKQTGINPLWIPEWPSIEPSTYDRHHHPERRRDDAALLAGIMGHNLCLDMFGGPSTEEAAAGIPVHGEASTAAFAVTARAGQINMSAVLLAAQLRVERRIALADRTVRIHESVENLSAVDRPVGGRSMTLGAPFLEKGRTELRAWRRAESLEGVRLRRLPELGAEFDWPSAPRSAGGHTDLRVYTAASRRAGIRRTSWTCPATTRFVYSPSARLAFGLRGGALIFRGWESGRKTTAGLLRRGTGAR
jgi:hypothetical protein